MPRRLVVAVCAAVFVSVATAGAWLHSLYHRSLILDVPQVVLVRPGDHLSGIGGQLTEQGWLPWSEFQLQVFGRLTAGRGHIKTGEYQLEPGMTVPELLEKLRRGDVIQRTITFPEGWVTEQWLAHLAANELITNTNRQVLTAALGEVSSWEGQFYPDTYAFTRGDSSLDILRRASRRMDEVLADVWANRSENARVNTPQDALILASIIEKETGYEGDRGLIASVFSNRLRIGMKLQSDPTVIYGLKDFDGDLKRSHLREEHDFNTYVIPGLPVGPICHPGRSSLEAAVDPETSPYFYFVAKGDGRSHFSETLEQHNRAVVQYQKSGRVKNYRSAPPEPSGDG